MDTLNSLVTIINGIVWGPLMLVLILGTGLYLSVGLKGISIRRLPQAFGLLLRGLHSKEEGEITPFNALMTSLSATIGTGNIAGVATAIALGGPGALFWMWLTALVGMATKYAEAVLAVHFRQRNQHGEHVGGPMYYIKNGLGEKWLWLAALFSFFGAIAGFGIGNTVQSHSVASALHDAFGIAHTHTGLAMMALVALVILGGIRRIAHVAGAIVPLMTLAYLGCGLLIVALNLSQVPAAFSLILHSAFNGHAAAGGFAGAAMIAAIRFGVARGIFSNEAGLGSAPIAHAHAQTSSPVRQGMVAMLGTFIDTIILCSVTGLAIVLTGSWTSGSSGAPLTAMAFQAVFPAAGHYIVSLSLAIFAFTTMIGWSVYGERCVTYLFGENSVLPFRLLWVAAIPLGAQFELEFVWLLADTFNALMAIPNLVALILLSPVVFRLSRDYFQPPASPGKGKSTGQQPDSPL